MRAWTGWRPTDKVALQSAAVLGQRFAADALRHLLENPGYDSRLLVENFLVRADGSEFMFCHALIRDGAYESLLHKRRRAPPRAAPPNGSSRATWCSRPSTSTAPRIRAPRRRTWRRATRSRRSSATPRRSP